jgi:hypothetical protein
MKPKEVLQIWVERFNQYDYEGLGELYSDDAINHQTALGIIEGKETIKQFQKKVTGLKMGCIEGTIKHYYHGTIENRQYKNRWDILTDNNFDPEKHITRNSNGILVPTSSCPQDIITKIESYFMDRKEDN